MLLQMRSTYWKSDRSLSVAGYARKKECLFADRETTMEELDFSEEACIERYVTFAYFEEDTEDYINIELKLSTSTTQVDGYPWEYCLL